MGWNYLSIPKRQWCNCWSLGMDNWFHPTCLHLACHYLPMQREHFETGTKWPTFSNWFYCLKVLYIDSNFTNVCCCRLHIIIGYGDCIMTLWLKQNARHFPDDIFICIFVNENVKISIKISLNFVPKGPINDTPALVQIMACCLFGAKPLSEKMLIYCQLYLKDYISLKFYLKP